MSDVVLIFLFEFIVIHSGESGTPEDKSFINIEADALMSALFIILELTFKNKPYCKRP